MTDVVILVPRRRDGGHRDRLWSHSRAFWAELFPNWPMFEGHHDDGPFNRSAAVNKAAESAGSWDVAVVIDSDVLPDPSGVEAAVEAALEGGIASGHHGRKNLSQRGTERVLGGFRGSWERLVQNTHPLCNSGALAIGRPLWDELGGFDELFVGWGYEDTAFEIAAETLSGKSLYKAPCDLWHLWHPRSPEHNHRLPGFKFNMARRDRYVAARGDRAAVLELLEEARSGVRHVPPSLNQRQTRIPRILHRTVPVVTSDETERFWYNAKPLLPGWTFYDWREPLDPADFPETSDLWPKCTSGAQKAGLIRLEVLHRWGGVYIDSDVELYRSLEPLLALEGFAAWEDVRCCPDAVLGFRAGHPALKIMLEKARSAVMGKQGAWKSGPGVTTSTLPGREDVLLLPPGTFYPYHYKEKHRREEDHASQPWTFGAHHWAHSWDGS